MNIINDVSIEEKLKILTEGAKYDVSCSSSGSQRAAQKGGLGNCSVGGICHSFTADGRCVSILKILLTNACEYDCLFCVNRRSNDVKRVRLSPREVADLVINFYRRNYIEGLFLSSAVECSPNHTMIQLIEAVKILRDEYSFGGYIHLKAIPGAAPELIDQAATLVDRMSINIELPSENSLKLLAPQKCKEAIVHPMKQLAQTHIEQLEVGQKLEKIPAGQTTQMIIGASSDSDGQIIRLSDSLYKKFKLKRVYYSSYVPVTENSKLPANAPDFRREHRLYEADWLLRFYGFNAEELIPVGTNFSLDVDPKCDWALRNFDIFPLEINTASYDMLLRVPGIGYKNAYRICQARKYSKLDFDSLKKLHVVLNRARHFVTANGKFYGQIAEPHVVRGLISNNLKRLGNNAENLQISMFNDYGKYTGEM